MRPRIAEERLRALQSVTDAALSHLPLEQMLTELLARVTDLLSVSTAAILLLEDDGSALVSRAAKGLEEEVERQVRIPFGRGFAGRIAATRRPVVVLDVDTADIVNPILREKGLRSLLGVPLMLESRVIGVLHVGSLSPRQFDDDDADLLQRAGDRAALAIGGRLAERERGLADAFQRSLIPPLPTLPGFAVAGRYRPAASAALGGDWYDAFPLPSGALGVAIGDVVGRGFQAAALMGQLRAALRAYAIDDWSPGSVLGRLSTLLRQLQPGWGATLLYAVLEPHAGTGTVARAGHPPPLVLDADGRARLLELPVAVPLAAVRNAVYEEARFELGSGSTVVLYTDGLIERPEEPLDAGLERLRNLVEDSTHDPHRLADGLMGTLIGKGSATDDTAVLVVTIPVLPDPYTVRLPADPDSIPLMRRTMERWLDGAGASREEIGEITLACSEACANAVEHAYGPDATEFEVEASSSAMGVTLIVRDAGQWRAPRGVNRGRGLTLMNGLMDNVELHRSCEGTAVHLTRRLAAQAA